MLQTSTLTSSDFTDYTWPETELARFDAYMASTAQLWTLPQTTPGIGHNNPPRLEETKFAEQIEAIVDSHYTGPQKLILLKIRLRSDHRTLGNAFPSYGTLKRAASVKDDRTVRDALRELVDEDEHGKQHGILTREIREGKSFSYGFSREHLQALITGWVASNRQRRRPLSSNAPPTPNEEGASSVPFACNAPSLNVPLSSLPLNGEETGVSEMRPATPHLRANGDFIIHARHGLMIPAATVSRWEQRFPHITDLEATITGLGTTILAKGPTHPGWTSPEGWMVKTLSEINQEAADKKQVIAARVARAKSAGAQQQPFRGKSRRAELDEA